MSKKITQWLIWLGLMCLGLPASAAQEIQLLTDYTTRPYAVDGVAPADSYTVRLAQWLSQQSAGRYHFVPRQVPKKRLLKMLENPNWRGVVAWVNPDWFADPERKRFLWSERVMRDFAVRISRRSDKVVFAQGHPLKSARFGGLSGYVYPHYEADFNSGLLVREDAQNDLSSVLKLKHRRIDLILLQASSLAYIRTEVADFDQWAYVDPQPDALLERYLFTSHLNAEVMAFINQTLPKLAQDPAWVVYLRPGEQ